MVVYGRVGENELGLGFAVGNGSFSDFGMSNPNNRVIASTK